MNNNTAVQSTVHVFQAAGLGVGPFRLSHVTAESGKCQFCNTSIVWRFHLNGVDGSTFYVGSDCVMKSGDAGLMRTVEAEVKRRQAEARKVKENQKLELLQAKFQEPETVARLKAEKHPNRFFASKGRTMHDYASWVLRFGSKTAKMELLKKIVK